MHYGYPNPNPNPTPTPNQVMHYGYPGSTGLPAMQYMLLDAAAAPPQVRPYPYP